jgi:hypothetical protein
MNHHDRHCEEGGSEESTYKHAPGLLRGDYMQCVHQHDERYGEDAKHDKHHIERTRLLLELFARDLVHANVAADVLIEPPNSDEL